MPISHLDTKHAGKPASPQRWAGLPLRVCIWSLIVFAAINLACSQAESLYKGRKFTYQSSALVFNEFRNLPTPPGVVLLGSSLFRVPFWQADFGRVPGVPLYDSYHRCRLLEEIFGQHRISTNPVIDLATDGAMVSDVYWITHKLISPSKKPDWVIYGIAPRDFCDSLLTSETKTPVFEQLVEPSDLIKENILGCCSVEERLDLVLGKLCFLYDTRLRWRGYVTTAWEKLLDLRKPAAGKHPGVPDNNACASHFQMSPEAARQRSIREYSIRYRQFNRKQFTRQSEYLDAFCRLSKQRGINVLIVNLPLTQRNIQMMPAGMHAQYRQTLEETTKRNGVRFVDLQKMPELFPEDNFYDTVHLNADGAKRLGVILSELLKGEQPKALAAPSAEPQKLLASSLH